MANTAEQILNEVGGAQNITHLTHCATRLRFTLKDATIIDDKKVDAIPGVLGAVPQSETAYQIVIGGGVADVYEEINSLMKDSNSSSSSSSKTLSNDDVKAQERNKIKGKNKFIDKFFEFLSDSFRPIIGVLLGASLIIALLNLFISFGVINDASDTPSTLFLNAIAQSVFYFLPVLIAYNASKKLKVDPWIGAVSMLALMTPQFLSLMSPDMYSSVFSAEGPGLSAAKEALTTFDNPILGDGGTSYMTTVFGLPMFLTSYKGNVFVPLLMSACLALLYKLLKKIIPSSVQLVFVPFLSMLIIVPFTAFVLGPIGVGLGSLLGTALSWLNSTAPFIFAIAIPLLYPFLVPLGLHWPLNALMLVNIDTLGYDFIQGPMGVWNFACFGASFGVLVHALREKDSQMSSVAGGALAAGLLGGVSEPSLYGIHLRYKKVYPRLLAGCATGGVIIAVLGFLFPSSAAPGVTTKIFAFTSLLTIPVFDQIWVYTIAIFAAFAVSAAAVIVFDYRSQEEKIRARAINASLSLGVVNIETILQKTEEEQKRMLGEKKNNFVNLKISSPVAGKTLSLKNSGDKVFAMKALGEGLAITNDSDSVTIVSPVDGVLQSVSPSKHAYTFMSNEGVGVLVHAGIDTVKLDGQGFNVLIQEGAQVKTGDKISIANLKEIRDLGYKVPIVVTVINTNIMGKVDPLEEGKDIKQGDQIIDLLK